MFLVSLVSASLAFAISARVPVTGVANLLIAMTYVMSMVTKYVPYILSVRGNWRASHLFKICVCLKEYYNMTVCHTYLNLIGQLEGNISPYCPLVIARAYSDAEVI